MSGHYSEARAQHFSTLYEAATQLNSSVYPDLSSSVTQPDWPQSHDPTVWLYFPYGWHSVSKLASTLTLQPQTVTEVASLGAWLQPRTFSIPLPEATSLPLMEILSLTVNVDADVLLKRRDMAVWQARARMRARMAMAVTFPPNYFVDQIQGTCACESLEPCVLSSLLLPARLPCLCASTAQRHRHSQSTTRSPSTAP